MSFASKALCDTSEHSQYGAQSTSTNFCLNTLCKEYPGLCKYVYYTMSLKAYGVLEDPRTRECAMAAFRQRRRTDPEFSRQLKKNEDAFEDGDFEAVDDLPYNLLQQCSITPTERKMMSASILISDEERRILYEQRARDSRLLAEAGKAKCPRS